jgi:hypothetical protein
MAVKKRGRKSLVENMETKKSFLKLLVNDKTKFSLYLIAETQRKSVDKALEELVNWAIHFYLGEKQ